MRIVFIEDNVDYRKSFVGLLEVSFPQLKKGNILEGGLYDKSKELLKSFTPNIGEKTIFLVDSNLNYSENKEDAIRGNGFNLVNQWIEDFASKAKTEGNYRASDNLKQNVNVLVCTVYRREQVESFEQFKSLKTTCHENLASFSAVSKREGPEPFLDLIEKIIKSEGREGKRRGKES